MISACEGMCGRIKVDGSSSRRHQTVHSGEGRSAGRPTPPPQTTEADVESQAIGAQVGPVWPRVSSSFVNSGVGFCSGRPASIGVDAHFASWDA